MATDLVEHVRKILDSDDGKSVLVTMTLIHGLVQKNIKNGTRSAEQAASLELLAEASMQGFLWSIDVEAPSNEEKLAIRAALGELIGFEAVSPAAEDEQHENDGDPPRTDDDDVPKEALSKASRIQQACRVLRYGHSKESTHRAWVPAVHDILTAIAREVPEENALATARFALRAIVPLPPGKKFDGLVNDDQLEGVLVGMRARDGRSSTRKRPIHSHLFKLLKPLGGPATESSLMGILKDHRRTL